jgi:hypothetical protein
MHERETKLVDPSVASLDRSVPGDESLVVGLLERPGGRLNVSLGFGEVGLERGGGEGGEPEGGDLVKVGGAAMVAPVRDQGKQGGQVLRFSQIHTSWLRKRESVSAMSPLLGRGTSSLPSLTIDARAATEHPRSRTQKTTSFRSFRRCESISPFSGLVGEEPSEGRRDAREELEGAGFACFEDEDRNIGILGETACDSNRSACTPGSVEGSRAHRAARTQPVVPPPTRITSYSLPFSSSRAPSLTSVPASESSLIPGYHLGGPASFRTE